MENFDERYAKLAEKEKRFIDYWLETGNATEAARRAGYTAKTESTMRSIGSNNLTKLAKYIEPLLEKTMLWFKENAYEKERLGKAIDRIGFDRFEAALFSDDLLARKAEILAQPIKTR